MRVGSNMGPTLIERDATRNASLSKLGFEFCESFIWPSKREHRCRKAERPLGGKRRLAICVRRLSTLPAGARRRLEHLRPAAARSQFHRATRYWQLLALHSGQLGALMSAPGPGCVQT